MRTTTIAINCCFAVTSCFAADVQVDPTPRFVVNTGGPAGRITAISFSADSSRLYVAGTDKCVHSWQVTEGVNGRPVAHLSQSLHWEVARADLGHIYAMATSPTQEELAIGGRCMRGQTGDIAVFDTGVGRIQKVLPEQRSKNPDQQPFGHWSRIHHLSYSPSGDALLSVSADNEMRLWKKNANWKSTALRNYSNVESNKPLPAVFVKEDTIVSAEESQAGCQLVAYTVNVEPPQRRLIQATSGTVLKLAASPMGTQWACATSTGSVNLHGPTGVHTLQPAGSRICGNLAFRAEGNLIVCNRTKDGKAVGIDLYDTQLRRRVDSIDDAGRPHVSCVAVSSNGKWLALSRIGEQSIEVWNLSRKSKSFDEDSKTVIQPHGRPIQFVSFAEGKEYIVAFDSNRITKPGPKTRYFNLTNNQITTNSDVKDWRTPVSNSDGWTIRTSDETGRQIEFWKGNSRRGVHQVDVGAQGVVRTACLIPNERGRAIAAAVATAGAPGVFVYSLPATGQPPRLLRYFRDHTHDITSLSASHDGRYLVSGSLDQTVRVWSLANLASHPQFSKSSAWGGRFFVNADRQLQAGDIHPAGIAYARGIRNGDIIDRVKCTLIAANGERAIDTSDPAEMLNAILQNNPYHNTNVSWHRDAQKFQRNIVAGWESLLTLFVDDHNEWVLFAPTGHFASSAAEGHRLMSWQFNRGPNVHPRQVSGGDVRRQLERPLLIRNILKAGSLHGAAEAVGAELSTLSHDSTTRVTKQQPELLIDSPRRDAVHSAGEKISIRARIFAPNDKAPHDFSVLAYANGLPVPVFVDSDGVITGNAPAESSPGRLRVLAYDDFGLVSSIETSYRVEGVVPRRLRLHYLIIGVDQYSGAFKPLQFAVADAKAIEDLLKAGDGPHYKISDATCRALFDNDVSRRSVTNAIDSFVTSLSASDSNDLLLVYVAGHGAIVGDGFHFIPADVTTRGQVTARGIPWSEFLRLAAIPCRKIVLIDACKAGSAISTEASSGRLKAAIRPLVDADMIVLSATQTNQNAYELKRLGHGVFTSSLLSGLSGRADGASDRDSRDGIVALREAAEFVARDVPRQLLNEDLYQQPTIAPRSLVEVLDVKLMNSK